MTEETKKTAQAMPPEQLHEHIRDLLRRSKIEVGDIEHDTGADDTDIGGWLNATITMPDGTTCAYGWWLLTSEIGQSSDVANRIARRGWYVASYDADDISQGGCTISDELLDMFGAAEDEDGQVEDAIGRWCDSVDDILAQIIADEGDELLPDVDVDEMWREDLARLATEAVGEMDLSDLVKFLKSLD